MAGGYGYRMEDPFMASHVAMPATPAKQDPRIFSPDTEHGKLKRLLAILIPPALMIGCPSSSLAETWNEHFLKSFSGEYYLCDENGRFKGIEDRAPPLFKIEGDAGAIMLYEFDQQSRSWDLDAATTGSKRVGRDLDFINGEMYQRGKDKSYFHSTAIPFGFKVRNDDEILYVTNGGKAVYTILYSPSGFPPRKPDFSKAHFLMFGSVGGMVALGTDRHDCPAPDSAK